MLNQVQIEENEDFEFDLSNIGLLGFSLSFEQNEETNEFEIYITSDIQRFPINDFIGNSITSDEGEIILINSEQKEVINDLLKSLLQNTTNEIEDNESK